MKDLKEEFWDRMGSVRSAMLGIKGNGRLIPMSPRIDAEVPRDIWFITAKGTELAKTLAAGAQAAQLVIADDGAGLYGDIDGTLSQSEDRKVLDDVWNMVAGAWFEKGKEDPDVCLLRFSPASGEISITPASGIAFVYQIAKANITGAKPDVGAQGAVVF